MIIFFSFSVFPLKYSQNLLLIPCFVWQTSRLRDQQKTKKKTLLIRFRKLSMLQTKRLPREKITTKLSKLQMKHSSLDIGFNKIPFLAVRTSYSYIRLIFAPYYFYFVCFSGFFHRHSKPIANGNGDRTIKFPPHYKHTQTQTQTEK